MVRYRMDGVRAVVLSEAVAAMTKPPPCVTHRWKRVGPFVVPLGESGRYGTSETYNAECQRCGRREWLHWPERVYPKLRWRS